MRLALPQFNSMQRVTARATGWSWGCDLDDSHRFIDIVVPAGVAERDVEVFCSPLDVFGRVDPSRSTIVIKTKQRSRKRG
jgi:hypothetical protein